MKPFVLSVAIALVATLSFGQAIDKPAATVRLTKPEIITVKQLQKQVTRLETPANRTFTKDERKLVLDGMIARALIEQAAERDKVTVSDAEVKARIDYYKKTIAVSMSLGRDLTDAELQQYVKNTGSTWEEFQKEQKYLALVVSYTQHERKTMLDSVKPVTDEEANDYYESNKKNYFINDMATLRHIFIDTRLLTSKEDRDKAASRAADIYKELKGGAKFDDLVLKYSEDTVSKYKGGLIGTLDRSDEQRKQLFGKDFFDAVFRMKQGDTSTVLQSNIGYHIVQVVERYNAKLLEVGEKIPTLQISVREYIVQTLTAQRQGDMLAKAADDIVAELKKKAEIKIFDENIAW